jgi:triacylglycerol lipase
VQWGHYRGVFSSLSRHRRRFAYALIASAALVASLLTIALLRDEALETGRIPVILVHGYGGSGESMSQLAAALRAGGRDVAAIDLPEHGEGDIDTSARALSDAVEATRAARVDLVGHSAGGVVIRAYLKNFGGTDRARRVVTLASPHHGASLADAAASAGPEACVDACAQLGRRSEFLGDLNAGDETPGEVIYISVWTAFDETVTPPDSAVLQGGATNVRVQDVCAGVHLGHGDLVRDPLATGIVIAALDEGWSTPGPSDCTRLRGLGTRAFSS